MIYSNPKKQEKKDKLSIGIYFRNFILKHESNYYLRKFLSELNIDFELHILGSSAFYIENKKMKSMGFYNDSDEFFSKITHFIYPRDNTPDPFPHTLLEAVHSNCQIIIPNIRTENFLDGVDDISSLIKHHKTLNLNTFYDNSNCQLSFDNLHKFYLNLFDNNFEFSFDRNKYNRIENLLDYVM